MAKLMPVIADPGVDHMPDAPHIMIDLLAHFALCANDDFRCGRGCRHAQIRNEIADGDIDLVTDTPKTLGELLVAAFGPGENDLHGTSASSSAASASGSSPLRRWTHAPSSSAINALSIFPSW